MALDWRSAVREAVAHEDEEQVARLLLVGAFEDVGKRLELLRRREGVEVGRQARVDAHGLPHRADLGDVEREATQKEVRDLCPDAVIDRALVELLEVAADAGRRDAELAGEIALPEMTGLQRVEADGLHEAEELLGGGLSGLCHRGSVARRATESQPV